MTMLLIGPDPANFWRRWSIVLPGGGRVDFAQPRRIVDKFPPLERDEYDAELEASTTATRPGDYPISEAVYQRLRASAWAAWFPPDADQLRKAVSYFDGKCAVCGIRLARPRAVDSGKEFGNLLVFSWWHPHIESGENNRVPLCHSCHTSKGASEPLQWLTARYGTAARGIWGAVNEYLLEARNW